MSTEFESGSVDQGSGIEGAAPVERSTPTTPAPSAGPSTDGLPEEQLYDVKVNGKTYKVPLTELLKGYSRTQDYTGKTTELARERQQWTERLGRYEQALAETKTFLTDRQRLQAYLQQLQSSDPNGAAEGSDEILTRKELAELLAKEREQTQKSTLSEFQKMMMEAETEQLTATYRSDLSRLYGVATEKWPQLKGYAHLQRAFLAAVQEQEPTSIDHAKQLLANEIRTYVKAMGWETGAAAGTPKPLQMEPPGGGAVPTPSQVANQTFKKLRDPKLRAQVTADLEAMVGRPG